MNFAISVMLATLGALSMAYAFLMWVGLQVAKVSAGEHADTASFWWSIVAAVIVGSALLAGAGMVKR